MYFSVCTGKESRARVNLITDVRAATKVQFRICHGPLPTALNAMRVRERSKPSDAAITLAFDLQIEGESKSALSLQTEKFAKYSRRIY